jgi:hypothetical protein
MWLIAAAIMAAEPAVPQLPAWLAGCWEHRAGEEWTEECWTAPRAGIMLGSGRSGKGNRLQSWEVMQIVRVDTDPAVPKLTFYGAPGGQNRTPFQWMPGKEGLTFVNVEHDYPQRIRYWREGKALVAEVALKDGTKAQRWRYARKAD